jgi:hypothetical protein
VSDLIGVPSDERDVLLRRLLEEVVVRGRGGLVLGRDLGLERVELVVRALR